MAAQPVLRRYTAEEDRLILETWWDPKRRAEVCEKLGRPREGINFRYYSLLRKMGKDPAAHKAEMLMKAKGEAAPPASQATQGRGDGTVYVVPGDLYEQVEALKKMWEAARQELQEYREAFGAWLISIGEAYRHGMQVVDINHLVQENARLREENARLQSLLERKDAHYNDTMRKLEFWLGQFLRLSSMQKIASLEDFIPRLKSIVDKWGTVTNAEIEVPAASDTQPPAHTA